MSPQSAGSSAGIAPDSRPGDRAAAVPADTTPRFIVGMSRAATTWLTKCLNEHTDTVAFGESLFWGRYYVSPQPDGRYSIEQREAVLKRLRSGECLEAVLTGGPGGLKRLDRESLARHLDAGCEDLPERPRPAEVFDRLCRAVAAGEGKRIAVEKTPHHINWLDRILTAFPDARIVVAVREPYEFMLSYKHQGDRQAPEVRRRFERRYHPLGCAIVWRGYMRAAIAAQARHPEQVLLVRFDDVKHQPEHVMDHVQRHFGIEPQDLASRIPPDNTSFPDQRRPELTGDDVFWMNAIAGRTMKPAGFEPRRHIGQPHHVIRSFIRLPWWMMWNLFDLRRHVEGSLLAYLWRWLRPARAEPSSTKSPQCAESR